MTAGQGGGERGAVSRAKSAWLGRVGFGRPVEWADKLHKKLRSVEGRQSFFINENIFRVTASSFAGQAMAATMAMATSRKFDGDENGDGFGFGKLSVDCGKGGSVQINFEGTNRRTAWM